MTTAQTSMLFLMVHFILVNLANLRGVWDLELICSLISYDARYSFTLRAARMEEMLALQKENSLREVAIRCLQGLASCL